MEFFSEQVFQEVFRLAEISNLNKGERIMYRSSLQDQLDYQSTIDFARKAGEQEGLEQGKLPFVRYLIVNTNFDDQKIATLAAVDVHVVARMRRGGSGMNLIMPVS